MGKRTRNATNAVAGSAQPSSTPVAVPAPARRGRATGTTGAINAIGALGGVHAGGGMAAASDASRHLPTLAAFGMLPSASRHVVGVTAYLADAAAHGGFAPASPHTRASRGRTSVRARFGELRTALAEGWEIVQPIFARPLWCATDDSATAFNFVLRRERATRLVTVPEGRTVQRFIRDRQLIVDYRR